MRLSFSRLTKRERIIFYLSLIIGVTVVFDRAILSQIIDRLNRLNEEVQIEEKKMQRSLSILAQEGFINREHKKYTEEVKQIHSDEVERAALHTEIVTLAKKSGIFLSDIKTSLAKEIGSYKKYIIEIEVESEIAFLVDFIYQLEKSSRLLRLRDFYLSPKRKNSPVLKTQLTITELLIKK